MILLSPVCSRGSDQKARIRIYIFVYRDVRAFVKYNRYQLRRAHRYRMPKTEETTQLFFKTVSKAYEDSRDERSS